MRYIRFYLSMFVVALAILSLGNWANGMEDEEDSKPIVKQDVYGHYGELLTCIENNSFTKAKYYWDLLKENLFSFRKYAYNTSPSFVGMELTELLFEGSDLFEILFINTIKAHLFFSLPEETLKRIIKCKYNREERLTFLKTVLSDIVNSNCCIEATELEKEINNFLKNTSSAERKRDLKQIREVLRKFKTEVTQETSEKKDEQQSPPMLVATNHAQILKAITKIGI